MKSQRRLLKKLKISILACNLETFRQDLLLKALFWRTNLNFRLINSSVTNEFMLLLKALIANQGGMIIHQ
jgi:hypothetical protein